MSDTPPLHYDIFISHNHADKEWALTLANRLAEERYNGRALRPWLDRQYLDPGDLATNSELTTALDRSRTLGLVLSPAALASEWVKFEVDHFLTHHINTEVFVMLRQTCELPETLRNLRVLDFHSEPEFQEQFDELVGALCPHTEIGPDGVKERIDAAIQSSLGSDPGGFGTGPTPARDDVYRELVRYNIDDGALEGLAIASI